MPRRETESILKMFQAIDVFYTDYILQLYSLHAAEVIKKTFIKAENYPLEIRKQLMFLI